MPPDMKHPRCTCGKSHDLITHETFQLAEAVSMTVSLSLGVLGGCRYEGVVALLTSAMSALHLAGVAPEDADAIVEEALVIVRRTRQEQIDESDHGDNVVTFPGRR